MFHPKYLGGGLSQPQVEIAKEWLINNDATYLPTAIAFQAEAAPLPASFFSEMGRTSNSVAWWRALGQLTTDLPEGFVDVMVALHSAVASSAALERMFSSFGLVMTSLHNKIGLQKAAKWCLSTGYREVPRSLAINT